MPLFSITVLKAKRKAASKRLAFFQLPFRNLNAERQTLFVPPSAALQLRSSSPAFRSSRETSSLPLSVCVFLAFCTPPEDSAPFHSLEETTHRESKQHGRR
jgi:hypothetical protein